MEMLEQAVQLGERAESSPTRAQWARLMDMHHEQSWRGVHADRERLSRRGTVLCVRGDLARAWSKVEWADAAR